MSVSENSQGLLVLSWDAVTEWMWTPYSPILGPGNWDFPSGEAFPANAGLCSVLRCWWVRTQTVMASWPISLLMRSPFAAWPLTPVVRDFSVVGLDGNKTKIPWECVPRLWRDCWAHWDTSLWSVGCGICLFWKFQTLAALSLWWEGGDSVPLPLLRNSCLLGSCQPDAHMVWSSASKGSAHGLNCSPP